VVELSMSFIGRYTTNNQHRGTESWQAILQRIFTTGFNHSWLSSLTNLRVVGFDYYSIVTVKIVNMTTYLAFDKSLDPYALN
jgi:hypothetical protein